MIEPEVLGIKPSKDLTRAIKICCTNVGELCGLTTLDYKTIYSIPRMWRIPNSINTKVAERSYKIPLTYDEMHTMTEPQIRELAKNPRIFPEIDISELTPDFDWWWKQWDDEFQNHKNLLSLRPSTTPVFLDMPACVDDMLKSGLKITGTRNRASVVLATYFKARGTPIQDATAALTEWVKRVPSNMTSAKDHDRVANVQAVVSAVYRDEEDVHYEFACSYIRSLGDSSNAVKCPRNECKYNVFGEVIEPRPVRLEDSTLACFQGVPITTEGLCAGKDYSPYMVPYLVNFECTPPQQQRQDSPCQHCNLHKNGCRLELRIKANDPDILTMIGVSNDTVRSVLFQKARVNKNCRSFRMKIIDYQNVRDVILVPKIQFTPENANETRTHSLVQGYFTGHDVTTNETYKLEAYPFPDPKKQYAVLLISKMSATALAWQEKLPEDMDERLKIFQCKGDPLTKIDEIWDDIEANVTRVFGRRLLGYAVDMIYHSVVSFFFTDAKDFVRRGWMEALIYGDTDTAKTTVAKAIAAHYQLGTLVNCETTSRTGLTYSVQETGNKWVVVFGVIPLNDRGLVWLDEFRSMTDDDRKELTQMRSDGVLQVTRVRQATVPARVRILFMSGPKRAMSEYDYGIESIWEVFSEREDIRRLDLVVIMGTKDVDPSIFHGRKMKAVPHIYNTEVCNMLIRWVWNLKPSQIKFEQTAIDEAFTQVKALTGKYTETIPVLKMEDLRYKLARAGAAIAARTYNTYDGGKTLTVEARHIKTAASIMDALYSTPTCGFAEKSRSEQRRESLDNVNRDKVAEELSMLIANDEKDTFADVMLSNKMMSKKDLEEMMGWEAHRATQVFRELIKMRLLRRVGAYGKYVKTTPFIDILRKLEIKKSAAAKNAEESTDTTPEDSAGDVESKSIEELQMEFGNGRDGPNEEQDDIPR
jgi:hypothetical protein